MKVFASKQYLLLISAPTLREYTEAHVVYPRIEQRHLVWMRAKRYGWREIGIRFACCTKTAQRHWTRSLQSVADQLNAVGK